MERLLFGKPAGLTAISCFADDILQIADACFASMTVLMMAFWLLKIFTG